MIETETNEQMESLLQFLNKVGIKTSVVYDRTEDLAISIVSEASLSEGWNSKTDEQWDELYNPKK